MKTFDNIGHCIFCKIALGEASCEKIYEDDYTIAFLSIEPEQPGHTLVIPKSHVENILDCPADVLGYTISIVQSIAQKQIASGAQAVKIVQNNRSPLQQVSHLHFHVIPYGGSK